MAKLPMKTELGIVALLILATAFHINMMRQFVNNAIGKLVALAVVAYVWKTYSKLVAFFLGIAVVTAMCKDGIEFMTDSKCKTDKNTKESCTDPTNNGTWDDSQAVGKKCRCTNVSA
jgi:hypothetical protein